MIRIDEDYIIKVDENNYTACRDLHKTKVDKAGNESMSVDVIGYYSNLKQAVKGIWEYKVRKSLMEEEHTLETAISVLQQAYKEFETVLVKATGGMEWKKF